MLFAPNCKQNYVIHTLCYSVAQSCPTLSDPTDYSMPNLAVLHYLLQFAQTHVCWVSDAIQSSHSLLLPSPALNLSQHQSLFQWVSSLLQSFGASPSASILSMNIRGWFTLELTRLIPQEPSRVLQDHNLKASVLQCSAFFTFQLSALDYWKNHCFDYVDLCWQSDVSAF